MRLKKKVKIYGLLIIVLFAVGLGALFFDMSSGYAYKNEEPVFQVIGGNKRVYEANTKFTYKENGTSYVGADKNEYLSDSPIYQQDNNETMVLPSDQIYVNGSTAKFAQVKAFSTFSNVDGLYYKDLKINGGFLFNGRNSYIFLENMELTINGKTLQVGPFTYVELNDYTYALYDVSNDYMESGTLYVDVVEAKGHNYVVDLANDIFTDSTGADVLIYINTASLDELK